MDEETRSHKERLLGIYQENLRELEIRAAKFGLNTPLYIINEIKDHRKNIDELCTQLRTNNEEVSFDQLLIGIEDLQRFVREEGRRTIREYKQTFGDQALLGFGLMAPLYGGILATAGLAHLYQVYAQGVYIVDQHNIVSIIIYVVGFLFSGYLTFKLGKWISNSKYEWFISRMGYDPFDRKKNNLPL